MGSTEQYDVFLSYNHAADGELATALRDGLQQFAKPWNRRRAIRVFLDRASLEASSSLDDALQERLVSARFLVLLASNESAASPWCDKEAGYWAEERDTESLLLVLTDAEGGLVWDRERGRFDAERSPSLPPALVSAFPEEPLWLDLRWVEAEGEAAELDLRSPRFRGAVATLASAVHGLPKDELDGEDVRQHRRFQRVRRMAIGALAVLTALAIAAAAFAFVQRGIAKDNEVEAKDNAAEAERQEGIAQVNEAEAVRQQGIAEDNAAEAVRQQGIAEDNAAEAVRQQGIAEANEDRANERARVALVRQLTANTKSDRELDHGLLLGVEAFSLLTSDDRAAGEDVSAVDALVTRLWSLPGLDRFGGRHTQTVSDIAAFGDDELITASWDGTIRRWRRDDLGPIGEFATGLDGPVYAMAVSSADDVAVIVRTGGDRQLLIFDSNGDELLKRDGTSFIDDLAWFAGGDLFGVDNAGALWRWDGERLDTGVASVPGPSGLGEFRGLAASPDGASLAVVGESQVAVFDTARLGTAPTVLTHTLDVRIVPDAIFIDDDLVLLHASTAETAEVVSLEDRSVVQVSATESGVVALLADGSAILGDSRTLVRVAPRCLRETCVSASGADPMQLGTDERPALAISAIASFGSTVVTGDELGRLVRWKTDPEARARLQRSSVSVVADAPVPEVVARLGFGDDLLGWSASPDGQLVAASTTSEYVLVEVTSGDVVARASEQGTNNIDFLAPTYGTPIWSETGHASFALNRGVVLLHRDEDEPRVFDGPANPSQGAVSADGRFVVTVSLGVEFGLFSSTVVQMWEYEDSGAIGAPMIIGRWQPSGSAVDVGADRIDILLPDESKDVLRGDLVSVRFGLRGLLDEACRVANRSLTSEEWDRFVGLPDYDPACRDGEYVGGDLPPLPATESTVVVSSPEADDETVTDDDADAPAPTTNVPPVSGPTCPDYVAADMPPYQLCDSGDEVLAVQQALTGLGFELTSDGLYGPGTAEAVRKFQAANGLDVDGIAGPNTLAVLFGG